MTPDQDPVKSAVYNPKEFRRSRGAERFDAGPALSRRHLTVVVAAVVVGWALYLWQASGNSPAVGTGALPPSGPLNIRHVEGPGRPLAPLKLTGSQHGEHCLLRFSEWQTGAPVMAMFVRSGETTETMFPIGQYRATVACGTTWHGTQLIGRDAGVDEVELPIVFTQGQSGQMHGAHIDLTRRVGGNLRTRPVFRW